MESSEAIRDRALVHFPVRFRSIRGWTTTRANYFNPLTNTARMHSVSDYSGPDCTRARAAAGSSLGSSRGVCRRHRIRDATGLRPRGRIMVVGPATKFGARAPIEDEVSWGRDKYTVRRETFTVARNTVYRLAQIFRDHILQTSSASSSPYRYINILSRGYWDILDAVWTSSQNSSLRHVTNSVGR